MTIQILYYFYTDLNGNKEEGNYVNGRRKRIKSFLPYVVNIITIARDAIQRLPAPSNPSESLLYQEIQVTFIQSFIQLQNVVGNARHCSH